MSARSLCSLLHKTNKSLVTLNRYLFTSRTSISNPSLQSRCRSAMMSQNVNYSQALGSLTKDQAHDLVFRLNEEERSILAEQLEKFILKEDKQKLEFAATPPPKSNELLKLCLMNSLPFVGFGFLDNFTMIIAGDYIEYSLGTVMTISTMAAAALGNTISDILGIGSAVYVERIVEVIGIRPPDLTPVQLEMKSARRASNFGRVFGITVGCLLGMMPLMFFKDKEKEDKDTAKDTKKSENEPKSEK